MAWVPVPSSTVVAARQRYTHLRPGWCRFESLDGEFEGFKADLELDGTGSSSTTPSSPGGRASWQSAASPAASR